MAKVALLIGIGEYEFGLNSLPAAIKDVEAMQQVLQHPEIGGFDWVKPLINPDRQAMEEGIYTLFANRHKEDLTLLFFSGHGIKDDSGNLFLATPKTRKDQGKLVQPTAVAASVVQDMMNRSRSKRQVVILDCCFSGAFPEGMKAKDDGSVPVKQQLGGEGRAILTSSTSTQYSFEQQGSDLSTYTRYLVEGIETGAADSDSDGAVSVDELHEYAKKKVQEAAPAQQPEIYPIKEGHKIILAKAPIGDPKLRYRKEVERLAKRGEISAIGLATLDLLRDKLGLLPEEATAIEAEILEPYREYRKRLKLYEQHFADAIARENPLSPNTRRDLEDLQEALGLRDEDVEPIRARLTPPRAIPPIISPVQPNPSTSVSKDAGAGFVPKRRNSLNLVGCGTTLFIGVIVVAVGANVYFQKQLPQVPKPTPTSTSGSCAVNPGELNVRSEPKGNVINTLKPGQKLSTTGKEQEGWIEISTPIKGWVFKKYTQPCSSATETPSSSDSDSTSTRTGTSSPRNSDSTPGGTGRSLGSSSDDFGKIPDDFGKVPDDFGKIPDDFGKVPDDFGKVPDDFGKIPDDFGKVPDDFGKASQSWCISTKESWERDKQRPAERRLHNDEYYQALLKENGCE